MAVAENPNRAGMLFAGTGHAFYYSLDDGAHWTQRNTGLPAAPVGWVTVQKQYHDVVVSTYGRGLYILRDLTTLEQPDEMAAGADAQLYKPKNGIRSARNGSASFLLALRSAPSDSIRWEITDQGGAVIRRMATSGRAGVNRVTWDLRGDAPMQPELRALAPDNPRIWEEPRFRGGPVRGVFHWGIEQPQRAGILFGPGTYGVRMSVNGNSYAQSFDVVRDPAVRSSDADVAFNSTVQRRVVNDIDTTVAMINQIEVVRKQIEDRLKENAKSAATVRALKQLDAQAMNVELQLLSHSELNSDDKWFVEQYKIYLNLIWLYGEIGTGAGDVAGGAEFKPTDAQMQTLQQIEQDLSKAKTDYRAFMDRTLDEYNRSAAGRLAPVNLRIVM
jgi:hypothetical protein